MTGAPALDILGAARPRPPPYPTAGAYGFPY